MVLAGNTAKAGTAHRLREAITQDQFVLYGQPIVPINGTACAGGYLEILVRYVEEETKLLPPGGFFSVLESLKLMATLDRWVVSRVVRRLAGLHATQRNQNIPRYSLNLSADALCDGDFPDFVGAQLGAGKLPAGTVCFEVSEADAQAQPAAVARLSSRLKPAGCGLTLTGYSGALLAPSLLPALAVQAVKFDPDLTGGLHLNEPAFARARTIRIACQAAGISTIGELVERQQDLDNLTKLGADYAQGHFMATPAPLQSAARPAN